MNFVSGALNAMGLGGGAGMKSDVREFLSLSSIRALLEKPAT